MLRRHDSWLLSQYKRYLKNGRLLNFDEFIDLHTNNGFFKKEHLYFLPQLQKLEEAFLKKPLVLFYETLRENPQKFIQDLIGYMQVSLDYDKIDYTPYHASYRDHQLVAAKHYGEKLKAITPSRGPSKMNKWVLRVIMYLNKWLFASKKEPILVTNNKLTRVKKFYERDWENCLAYARNNTPWSND